MEKKQKLEIDIDIRDLLWEFLRGWRVIVCCALTGGILLGAMSYVSSYREVNTPAVPNDTVTATPTAQEVIDALNIDEFPEVVAAVELKAQIDDKTEYLKESILMQIDPFQEDRISLEYLVRSKDAATAMSSYENFFANGVFGEDAYTNELISFVYEKESNAAVVEIIHVDADSCAALAENVKAAWKEHTATLEGLGVVQDTVLVSEVQNVVVDKELHELQDAYLKECMDDQDTLAKMRADMNSNQVSAYVHMWKQTYGEEEETTENVAADTTSGTQNVTDAEPPKASVDVKKAGLGMVVGAVLAIIYIFAAYLMTGKLRTANEVEKLYGVKMLGTVQDTQQKKKAFAAVDKMIWRLQHLGTKAVTSEEALKLAAASVAIQCRKQDVKTVYVSSSRMEAVSAQLLEALKTELKAKGITMQTGADIAADADALSEAANAGNMLFIEKERKSAYKGMLKCVQLCANNHIEVLGMVVVEI